MTAKNEQFCREFMIDMNATQAAIRCGYSPKTANVQASRLLTKPHIKDRIQELKLELQKETGISAIKVITELAKIGFSNIQGYIAGGNLISDISEVTEDQGAAVASIKTTIVGSGKTKRQEVSIKLHDKVSALEKLGRHLGIFESDNSQRKPIINVAIDE